MDNLFYTEAYVLSALRNLKDDADVDHIANLLLGFYVCSFIGMFTKTQRDDFIKKIENLQQEGEYLSILDKLRDLAFLESKKTTPFDGFIVNDISTKNNKKLFIDEMISRNSISLLVEKMMLLLCVKKRKHSKYEVRFFWPSQDIPEVYDLFSIVFNKKYYNYKSTSDNYVLIDNNDNLKFRKDELQLKVCSQSIHNINQFSKKIIIKFPIKGKEIKKFLQQKNLSDSAVFNTPEDLLKNLSHFPGHSCVEVIKKRYVRKMEDHTKIEFSAITIQGKEWKTICIESKSFEKVLALSLLVNQKNAKKLSYNQFLHQYGLDVHKTK